MIKFCIVKNGIFLKTTNFLTLSTPHCTCRPILFPTRHYYNPSIWLMIRRVWLQFPPSFSHSVLKKNDMSIFAHSSPGYLVRAAESMISTPGQFSICLNRSELEWSCRCWNWEAQIFDFNNKIQKKCYQKDRLHCVHVATWEGVDWHPMIGFERGGGEVGGDDGLKYFVVCTVTDGTAWWALSKPLNLYYTPCILLLMLSNAFARRSVNDTGNQRCGHALVQVSFDYLRGETILKFSMFIKKLFFLIHLKLYTTCIQ